jgi:hypothetical protein
MEDCCVNHDSVIVVIPHEAWFLEVKNFQSTVLTASEKPFIVLLESYGRDIASVALKYIFISELFWSKVKYFDNVMGSYSKVLSIGRQSHLIDLSALEFESVLGKPTRCIPEADSVVIPSCS